MEIESMEDCSIYNSLIDQIQDLPEDIARFLKDNIDDLKQKNISVTIETPAGKSQFGRSRDFNPENRMLCGFCNHFEKEGEICKKLDYPVEPLNTGCKHFSSKKERSVVSNGVHLFKRYGQWSVQLKYYNTDQPDRVYQVKGDLLSVFFKKDIDQALVFTEYLIDLARSMGIKMNPKKQPSIVVMQDSFAEVSMSDEMKIRDFAKKHSFVVKFVSLTSFQSKAEDPSEE